MILLDAVTTLALVVAAAVVYVALLGALTTTVLAAALALVLRRLRMARHVTDWIITAAYSMSAAVLFACAGLTASSEHLGYTVAFTFTGLACVGGVIAERRALRRERQPQPPHTPEPPHSPEEPGLDAELYELQHACCADSWVSKGRTHTCQQQGADHR